MRDQVVCALGLTDLRKRWDRPYESSRAMICDFQLKRYAIMERDTGDVVVRSAEDGRELVRLPRPDKNFWYPRLEFSPDGTKLAFFYSHTNDIEKTLDIWQLDTREKIYSASVGSEAIAFHPDGRRLIIVTPQPAVSVWDLEQRREQRHIDLSAYHSAMALDRSGKLLAVNANSMAGDKPQPLQVRVWEFETGVERAHWTSDVGDTSLNWSSDGRLLASGSGSGKVYVWDVADNRLAAALPGHTDVVLFSEFAFGSKLLATGGWDGTTRLWNAVTGECLAVARGTPLHFSQDGSQLAYTDLKRLCVWDVIDNSECLTLNPFNVSLSQDSRQRRFICSADFSADGQFLAVGCTEGVSVFDAHSGELLARLDAGYGETVLFHRNGKGLLTHSPAGLRYWPMERSTTGHRVRFGAAKSLSPKSENDQCNAVWLPGSNVLAVTDPDRSRVRLLDLSQPESEAKQIAELPTRFARMTSLAVTPDGE